MTTPSDDEGLREEIASRVREWFGEPVLAVEDELMALISQKTAEAYKQGYIAGGIDTLTNEEVISE